MAVHDNYECPGARLVTLMPSLRERDQGLLSQYSKRQKVNNFSKRQKVNTLEIIVLFKGLTFPVVQVHPLNMALVCCRALSPVQPLKLPRHHYFSSKSFSFCGMWPIFRIFNFSGGIWLDDKKCEWKNGGALWLSAVKMQNVNANISQTNDSNEMESTWQQLWLTMSLCRYQGFRHTGGFYIT